MTGGRFSGATSIYEPLVVSRWRWTSVPLRLSSSACTVSLEIGSIVLRRGCRSGRLCRSGPVSVPPCPCSHLRVVSRHERTLRRAERVGQGRYRRLAGLRLQGQQPGGAAH